VCRGGGRWGGGERGVGRWDRGTKSASFSTVFWLGCGGGLLRSQTRVCVCLFGVEMWAGAAALLTPSLSPFSFSPWTCKAACVFPSGFYNISLFGQSESCVEFFFNENL
jgi:hypothetical protein